MPLVDPEKAAYVEKHVLPWLTEHLKMRAIGFQVFPAVQGAVLVGYGTSHHPGIPILGLALCASFLMWDSRNRDVFNRLHRLSYDLVEGPLLTGTSVVGLHEQAIGTLKASGRFSRKSLSSHTWAIRLMVISASVLWFVLLGQSILSYLNERERKDFSKTISASKSSTAKQVQAKKARPRNTSPRSAMKGHEKSIKP